MFRSYSGKLATNRKILRNADLLRRPKAIDRAMRIWQKSEEEDVRFVQSKGQQVNEVQS